MAQKDKNTPMMITILGPTATGKTTLAAHLAAALNGEIISADSRQVYRGMDLGTGKDYEDYLVNGKPIACHLIDIADPGYEYNVFEFQRDFLKSFGDIISRGKLPVLCGGTGMYLEAVLSGYILVDVPEDAELRSRLGKLDHGELINMLHNLKETHNITDTTDRGRTIRAIEIAEYKRLHTPETEAFPKIDHKIFGVHFSRELIRQRITLRLKQRLESGMIEEVKSLLSSNLKPEQLSFYGLEYRYLTDYVTGKCTYDEMFRLLNTAIHQFAKRQMTWYRRMEKKGFEITWIEGSLPLEEKVKQVIGFISTTRY